MEAEVTGGLHCGDGRFSAKRWATGVFKLGSAPAAWSKILPPPWPLFLYQGTSEGVTS